MIKYAIITVLISTSLAALPARAQELRTFSANGLYGFKKGESIVIPARFSYAADFSAGYAAVLINKKWGFIDTQGRLVVPSDLERVESFHNGFARYYSGDKFGLIDTTGKKVVPAILTDIIEYSSYLGLQSGKLYGVYLPESGAYIEPKYTSVSPREKFILATKEFNFDVYTRDGKLLAENLSAPPRLLNSYAADYCDMSWVDSCYIVDVQGKKMTHTYSSMNTQDYDFYKTHKVTGQKRYFEEVMCLNMDENGKYFDDETEQLYGSKFHLFFDDGTLYDDAVYSDFMRTENWMCVKRNGVLNRIMLDGTMIPCKYVDMINLNHSSLLYLPDKSVDVVRFANPVMDENNMTIYDTITLAHFKGARVLYHDVYDAYSDPDYYGMEPVSLPILVDIIEVEGEGINEGKFALYDITNSSYCSNFDSIRKDFVDIILGKERVYLFNNEEGYYAFRKGNVQSPFVYDAINQFPGFGTLLTKANSDYTFLNTIQNTIVTIPESTYIIRSTSITEGGESEYVDPETGDVIWRDNSTTPFEFEFPVLMTSSETPKFGLIDSHGNIILPKYNEVLPPNQVTFNDVQYPFVITKLNNKYGAYDLRLGTEIPPIFDSLPEFIYSRDMAMLYTQPYLENRERYTNSPKPYYQSSTNKKFTSLTPEVTVFSLHGKKGLLATNDFTGEYDTIVPAIYATIQPAYNGPYCVVGNKAKQMGLISLIGDTLLPLSFNKIQWNGNIETVNDNTYSWFNTYANKKQGLYNASFRKSIPARFDAIDAIQGMTRDVGFVVRNNGKCGLYSAYLDEAIDCDKQGIDVALFGDEGAVMTVQQADRLISFYIEEEISLEIDNPDNWYDFVVGDYGYRRNAGGYDQYMTGNQIYIGQVKNISLESTENQSYELFEANGLLGFRDIQTKKVILQPSLRYVRMLDDTFVVKFIEGEAYAVSIFKKKDKYKLSQW